MMTQLSKHMIVPDGAKAPLVEAVKSLRAALLVIEPWLETQPASRERLRVHQQVNHWKATAKQIEQQVLTGGAAR